MKRMARCLVMLDAEPALAKDEKCKDVENQVVGTADFTTNQGLTPGRAAK